MTEMYESLDIKSASDMKEATEVLKERIELAQPIDFETLHDAMIDLTALCEIAFEQIERLQND